MADETRVQEIYQLNQQRERYRSGGSEKEIEKQHQAGKLTVRERLDLLFDEDTFCELELWAQPIRTGFDIDERFFSGDAVVTGHGKIDGRTVMVYAHDYTVMGGTQAAVQHSKVTRVIDTATRMLVPYVGIVDCAGIRLQDAMGEPGPRFPLKGWGLHGGGSFMYSPPWASGVVPQIAVMLGPQFAGSSYSPILKDFLIIEICYQR